MGSMRNFAFTAVKSLPWPAGSLGAFFTVRDDFLWLLSQQRTPITQGFNQYLSTVPAPIAWLVLAIYYLAVLAMSIGSYQPLKLLETLAKPESMAANIVALAIMQTTLTYVGLYSISELSKDGKNPPEIVFAKIFKRNKEC